MEGSQGDKTQVFGTGVTTFLSASGLLNFMMHDRHTGPVWNVLMWTLLFLGQGIQVSLYCQEWYARQHCPLPQVRPQSSLSSPSRRTHLPFPIASPLLMSNSTATIRGQGLFQVMGSHILDVQGGQQEGAHSQLTLLWHRQPSGAW